MIVPINRKFKKLASFLIILLSLYVLMALLISVFQRSLIFFPQTLSPSAYLLNNQGNIEQLYIPFEQGQLHGWFCQSDILAGQKHKIIIYFGGNAEEVSHMAYFANEFKDWSLVLVNYPGYGISDGRAGEGSFFNMALSVYDYMMKRNDVDKGQVLLLGRSIGTGVATYLASQRKVSGVIAISPYESLTEVAKGNFRIFPVGLMLKHRFEAGKYAQNIDVPLLSFYGTEDHIIPPKHSIKLTELWKGPSECIALKGFGHNDILESEDLWWYIGDYLMVFNTSPKPSP